MRWPRSGCILILAAIIVALALRLPRLDQRPMHGDEAVGAIKFGALLEDNYYRYNPYEYHGPTLNYLTLIPAWLSSARLLTDVNEYSLRIVPVFFGTMLILMLLPVAHGLGWPVVVGAGLLTAISPAMAYYSRYYIHEMLLVCFTFGAIIAGYKYTRSRNLGWGLLLGVCLGLMYATKETSIIVFASLGLALVLTVVLERRSVGSIMATIKTLNPRHCAAIVAAAAAVSILFFSSFFTNPRGIIDSLMPWGTYFNRAAHNELHIHPWYYYLQILIYTRYSVGPAWSEALILILAGMGFAAAITGKVIRSGDPQLLRFIAFYSLLMTIIYSLIPYKTPWIITGFLHGMIILAGFGVVALFQYQRSRLVRILIGLLLAVGGIQLAWQAYLANYRYYADPFNPYVYAHTSPDAVEIAKLVTEVAEAHPDGHNLYIEVICTDHDYWPLPWYLRSFPNVGWWGSVQEDQPAAAIILASPEVEGDLIRKLYDLPPPGEVELYLPLFSSYRELRPSVELRGYVSKDLWDRYLQSQLQSAPSSTM